MPPSLPAYSPANRRLRQSKLLCDLPCKYATSSVFGAHFNHLSVSEFRDSVALATRNTFRLSSGNMGFSPRESFWIKTSTIRIAPRLPILANHIRRIISRSSFKKMLWIYASTVVAFMKREHTFRSLTKSQSEGDSMGLPHYFYFCPAKQEAAVSIGKLASCPVPALSKSNIQRIALVWNRPVFVYP